MRTTGLVGAAALVLLTAGLASCGGDAGPSTTITTPNPQDAGFALISRTTGQGTTWHIVPVPASGTSGLTAQSPGATQIGTVAGAGSSSFRWTGRRSVALCAEGRSVQAVPTVTVGGQPFVVAQSCTPAMASNIAPNPSAVSPFGIEMTPPPMPQTPSGPVANPYGAPPAAQAPGGVSPISPATSGLPPRRPGLWRTTMRSPDGQTQSEEICLTDDRARNWTPGPEEAQACSQYRVRAEGAVVIGEAVCNTPNGQVTMRAQMAGDFNSAYQGRMDMRIQTPQGPMSQQVQTYSQYMGPCATN